MSIDAEQVAKVARLAQLDLEPAELQRFSEQLAKILEHFEQLDRLDTTAVEPTSHVVPLRCPQRADSVQSSDKSAAIVERAPRQQDGLFVVPKVID